METKPDEVTLDLSGLRLPTDRVTIAQLRLRQPTVFDRFCDAHISADLLEILATIQLELVLVRRAYAKSLGALDPHPHESRRDLIRILNDDYRRYGLSAGIQQTRQMIRDVESMAAEQAKTAKGRAR